MSLLPACPPSPFTVRLPQLLPGEAAQRLSLCPIQHRIMQRAAAAAISSSLTRSERKERACVLLGYLYLWLRSRRKRHSPRLAIHPGGAQLRLLRILPCTASLHPGQLQRGRALSGEIILPAEAGWVVSRHHVSPATSCRGQQSSWQL